MNLQFLISQIADQADDFLEGATSVEQARAGVSEMVTMHGPKLNPAERTAVVDGVMALLKQEGFFENTPGESSDKDEN